METYPKIYYPEKKCVFTKLKEKESQEESRKGWTESHFRYKLDKYFQGYTISDVFIDEGKNIKYSYEPDYVIDPADDFLDVANSKWVRDTLEQLARALNTGKGHP
jgi:hypothetical protein